jgi:nicotinamidase-related amidase
MADPALILVDLQAGFHDPKWGKRNNSEAEINAAKLLHAWREAGAPVFHVRHLSRSKESPLHPSSPGADFQDIVAPLGGESVVEKDVNSAFIGTDLEAQLRARGVEELVICGLTTDHCVSTTTRMASNLDFKVTLISDATATFGRVGPDGRQWSAEEMHDSALASLYNEFAKIETTERVLSFTLERAVAVD